MTCASFTVLLQFPWMLTVIFQKLYQARPVLAPEPHRSGSISAQVLWSSSLPVLPWAQLHRGATVPNCWGLKEMANCRKMDIHSLWDICMCFLDHLWLQFSCLLVGKKLFDSSSLGSTCFPKEQWGIWRMRTYLNIWRDWWKGADFWSWIFLTRNLPIYWLFFRS